MPTLLLIFRLLIREWLSCSVCNHPVSQCPLNLAPFVLPIFSSSAAALCQVGYSRGKLAQLVADHVLRDSHVNIVLPIVDLES